MLEKFIQTKTNGSLTMEIKFNAFRICIESCLGEDKFQNTENGTRIVVEI